MLSYKSYQICARKTGDSPDCMKNPLACAPVMNPLTGASEANCSACLVLSMAGMDHGSMLTAACMTELILLALATNNKSCTRREWNS